MAKRLNPVLEVRQLRQQLAEALTQLSQADAREEQMKGFTLQQALDMAQIALHQPPFGFGPERQAKFAELYRKTFIDFATDALADDKDDPELVYTKACVDRALRDACGPDVLPFDQRYALDHLYIKDRDLPDQGG